MIRAKVTVTDKNPFKLRYLIARLRKDARSFVTIGVHEDAGEYTEGGSPPSVFEVAMWQEFGTENIPERAFLRTAIDGNVSLINEWRIEALENVIYRGWTMEKALNMMGFRLQELVRNQIKSDMPPPYGTGNSGASVEEIARRQDAKQRKWGRSDTLIASGLMMRSVTYRVHLHD